MVGGCGSSMLRPSPNHGTQWLHNDDDDDDDDDDDGDGDDAPELFSLPRPLYAKGISVFVMPW